MGQYKLNNDGAWNIHPEAGTYHREMDVHLGSGGVTKHLEWNGSTGRTAWISLWDAALAGGTSWATAGEALMGSTDWAALDSDARDDLRARITGRC